MSESTEPEPAFDKKALDAILKGGGGRNRTRTPTPDEIKKQIEGKIKELITKFGSETDPTKKEAIRKDLDQLNKTLSGISNGNPGGSDF